MITVFGILIATTYASVGLLAIWAGVSRRHWFLRTAVVTAALSPLLFVPAYEPFVALAVEAVVVAFGTRLAAGQRHSANSPSIESRFGGRRPRYSVASLLWLMVVVAFLAALWTRLPKGTVASWANVVLLGVTGGIAVLIGTWLVLGRWRLRWRAPIVVAALAILLVCLIYFDESDVSALGGMRWPPFESSTIAIVLEEYADPLAWTWCWILPLASVFVVGWLLLAMLAGWIQGQHIATGQRVPRQRGVVRRWLSVPAAMLLIGLTVAMMIPPFRVTFRLLTPTSIPTVDKSKQNAFDDFLTAGKMMSESTTLMAGDETTPIETLDAESKQYQAAFERLRIGLSHPFWWPLNYTDSTVDMQLDEVHLFLNLSRALSAKGAVAESRGQIIEAVRSYIDCVRFGEKVGRGGLMVHRLVAISVEGIGCRRLTHIRDQLTAHQCRRTIDTLRTLGQKREPLSDTFLRERAWQQHASGWFGHLYLIVEDVTAEGSWTQAILEEAERRQLAIYRLLLSDLAVRAYRLDCDELLGSLREFVPDYLPDLPLDPYSDKPLAYRKTADRFLLYSVYSDGEDDNGEPPVEDEYGDCYWFEGHCDLTLDHWFAD